MLTQLEGQEEKLSEYDINTFEELRSHKISFKEQHKTMAISDDDRYLAISDLSNFFAGPIDSFFEGKPLVTGEWLGEVQDLEIHFSHENHIMALVSKSGFNEKP